jgi:branched-chain amino acid aminotransferase
VASSPLWTGEPDNDFEIHRNDSQKQKKSLRTRPCQTKKRFMPDIYYIDGEFVPAGRASLPVDDLAILRGYGVFDFLRTYGGKPVFLGDHVARLQHSAAQIGLELPWHPQHIIDLVLKTLARNSHPESNIRIVATGGSSPDFITPSGHPRLLILVTALMKTPQWWYRRGVNIITLHVRRSFPGAKSIDYIPATLALKTARRNDAIEAVYLDKSDRVLEGTTSNIFAFFGNRLVTPDKKILSGVTRKNIMRLAGELYALEVRQISREELLRASEIFITSTNKGVVPVVRVDETVIGQGAPGRCTLKLMDAFKAHTMRLAESYGDGSC